MSICLVSCPSKSVNKFILGSGVVGLLARHILGPEWKIIPFKKSRFYSYIPALADDFIVSSPEMGNVLSDLRFLGFDRRYTRAFSYNGELIFSEQSFVKQLYHQKLFGDNLHPAAAQLTKTDFIAFKTTASELYDRLLEEYMSEIKTNADLYGEIENISDHHIKTNKANLEFEKVVSTIPLDALAQYMGQLLTLPALDVWYYLVKAPTLDFEGALDVLVADAAFDFFKVSHVAPHTYLFNCKVDLGNPARYLGAFLNNNLEVQRQTTIAKAIPLGAPPNLSSFESADVYPVGCHGQWDMFMDVSSSVNRLLKLRTSHA